MGLINRITSYFIDKRLQAFQSVLMSKHIAEVENIYRQMRGWRHDYHNHIQAMKACLYLGQYDKLDAYLDEIDSDLNRVDTVVKTGNIMVDAILNSKVSMALSKNINVNVKALVPKDLKLSEVDLCVIIGNLLDNATEACMRIENEAERFIRIYIDIIKEQLYVYVSNSMVGSKNSSYKSTKNENEHGFGLMRIDKIVEQNGGYINRQNEQGIFATEVMLPL